MNIFENPIISEQQLNSFVKDIVKANKGVPPPSPPLPPPQPQSQPQPIGAPFSPKTFDPMVYKNLSDTAVKFGYNFTVENGQFRFGPPLSWKKDQPAPRKTEIFICQIPRQLPMLDLLLILFKIEKFFDFRMMFNFSNLNKGFAFCRFFKPADAVKAINILNAYELERGRDGLPIKLVVLPSEDKTMLSIYPLPTTVTLNQINQLLIKCEIDENSIKNIGKDENTFRRGVKWLITFDEHRSAALAKRKLMAFKNAWSSNFTVSLHSSDQEKSSPQSTPTPITTVTSSVPPNRKALLPSPPPLILSLPRPLTSKKKKFPKSNGGSCFPGQRNIVNSYRHAFDPSNKFSTKFDNFNPLTACGSSY